MWATDRLLPAASAGAAGLLLAAMAVLPFLDVVAKYLGEQSVPVVQIVWARLFFGMLITLPVACR